MAKIVKILFYIIIGLFILYLGTLFVLKNSFNTNALKKRINRDIIEKISEYNKHHMFEDKEIKFFVNGNISLTIFPKLKLVINNVVIENVQYRDILTHINIRKIEVKLNFNKFFSKKLEFEDIFINGATLLIENNKLPDFYMTKKTIKKIVKLDDNEVYGVKDKLKNILMGDEIEKVEEGYREIEIEEDARIDLDNEKVKLMLVDLFKTINNQEFTFEKNTKINFSNSLINIIKKGDIQKEFKNINGNLNINSKSKELKLRLNFLLNNIDGTINIKTKEKYDNFKTELEMINSQNDKININFDGNNLLTNSVDKINGNFKTSINISNFNNFIQWLLPVDSPFYYRFDYKKAIEYSSNIKKTGNSFVFSDLKIKADDININGNVYMEDDNKIELNVENINFDQFILNVTKSTNNIGANDILIFKHNNLEDLVKNIPQKDKFIDNTTIKINIKKLTKNNKILKDSILDFEIIKNNFKINNVKLDFSDFIVEINNQQNIDNYYYNNLEIKGSNFNDIAKIFNAENIIKIDNFDLQSNIFVYNNTIYLYDVIIKDGEKVNINGSLEYSFDEKEKYLASKITIDSLGIVLEKNEVKTLKEKFLWLNNFTNEVFLDLTINNLSFNEYKNIFFDSKIQYSTGFINLYHIKDIRLENIESIKGNILLTVNEKFPRIDVNLFIDKMSKEIDMLSNIFDVERYKNIILNTEIDKKAQEKYWINKLFKSPTWNEINGDIILKFRDLKINNSIFSNVDLNSKIEDGLISINKLNLIGLGGSTDLRGTIDLKINKTFNLILTETIYNIEEIFKLLFPNYEQDILTGTIGVGGIFKATGFNSSVFLSSMNLQAKFVGQNLFIKKLGLEGLRAKLGEVYTNEELLNNFNSKEYLLNDTGTLFNEFNGSLVVTKGISNLILEAKGKNLSNKLTSKIDNSSNNLIVDMINTSVLMIKVGKNMIPLYTTISFKEDFNNKAKLIVNTSQIDEYLEKIKQKDSE